jgi:hypothetical protein
MKKEIKNKGFIELIILIIIALLLMKYFGITISGVINWFESFFKNVLK